jgi:hypothetical protein
MKIRITFDATAGVPIRDGDSDTLVQSWIDGGVDVEFVTGTSNVIDSVRLALAQDKLTQDQVVYVFEGSVLVNNGKSGIKYWPKGFCDHASKRLRGIAGSPE